MATDLPTMNEAVVTHEWTQLCLIDDIPAGGMLQVAVEGMAEPVLVYRLDDGVYVTDDMCTHAMVSLYGGEVADGQIYCPLHGGAFDIRTGTATESPCRIKLKTYPVRQEGETISARLAK